MLSLLPFDPAARVVTDCEPGVDRLPQVRLASQAACEREFGEFDAEAPAQVAERPETVQLGPAVEPVAGFGTSRHDELVLLEVTQHPRRPAAFGCCGADGEKLLHGLTLSESCQGSERRPLRGTVRVQGAEVPSRP